MRSQIIRADQTRPNASSVVTPSARRRNASMQASFDKEAEVEEVHVRRNMAAVERVLRARESSDEDHSPPRNQFGPQTPRATAEQILRRRQVMFDSDDDDDAPFKKLSRSDASNFKASGAISPRILPGAIDSSSQTSDSRFNRLARLWNENEDEGIDRKSSSRKPLRKANDSRSYNLEKLSPTAANTRPRIAQGNDVILSESSRKPGNQIKKFQSSARDFQVELPKRADNVVKEQSENLSSTPRQIKHVETTTFSDAKRREASQRKMDEIIQKSHPQTQSPMSSQVTKLHLLEEMPTQTSSSVSKRKSAQRNYRKADSDSDSDSDSDDLDEIAGRRARVALLTAPSTPRNAIPQHPTSLVNSRTTTKFGQDEARTTGDKISSLQREVKMLRHQLATQTAVSERQSQLLAMEVAQAQDEQSHLHSVICGLEQQLRSIGVQPTCTFALSTHERKNQQQLHQESFRGQGMILSADVVLDDGDEIKTLSAQNDRVWEDHLKRNNSDNFVKQMSHGSHLHNGKDHSSENSSVSDFSSSSAQVPTHRGDCDDPFGLELKGRQIVVAGELPGNKQTIVLTPQRYKQGRIYNGQVKVSIKEVQNLGKSNYLGMFQVFAMLSVGSSQRFRTDTISKMSSKSRNEFEFNVNTEDGGTLLVEIFDQCETAKNELLGCVRIPLRDIVDPDRRMTSTSVIEKTLPVMDSLNNIIRNSENLIALVTVVITCLQTKPAYSREDVVEQPSEDPRSLHSDFSAIEDPKRLATSGKWQRPKYPLENHAEHKNKRDPTDENDQTRITLPMDATVEYQNNIPQTFPTISPHIESEPPTLHMVDLERPRSCSPSQTKDDKIADIELSLARFDLRDPEHSVNLADPGLAKEKSFPNQEGSVYATSPGINAIQKLDSHKHDRNQPKLHIPSTPHQHHHSPMASPMASPGSRASPARSRIFKSIRIRREQLVGAQPAHSDRIGIGISFGLTMKGDFFITGMAQNGPAKASGLIKRGDKLLAVDGVSVKGMDVNDVVRSIIGLQGTVVTLDIASLPDDFASPQSELERGP